MTRIPHKRVKQLVIAFFGVIILLFVIHNIIGMVKKDKVKKPSSAPPIRELAPYSILSPPTWLYKATKNNIGYAVDPQSGGVRLKIGDKEYFVDKDGNMYEITSDGSLKTITEPKDKAMINRALIDVGLASDEGKQIVGDLGKYLENVSPLSFTDDEIQQLVDYFNNKFGTALTADDFKKGIEEGKKLSEILSPSFADKNLDTDKALDAFLKNSGVSKEDFLNFLDQNNMTPEEFLNAMKVNNINSYKDFLDKKNEAYPSKKEPELTSRAVSNKVLASSIVPNPPENVPQKKDDSQDTLKLTPYTFQPGLSDPGSNSSLSAAVGNLSNNSNSYAVQNNQNAKKEFVEKYENIEVEGEFLTQNSLAEGTVIPCILINGINSDLPGMIIAQATQNIYDSLTHRNLLIPKGTRFSARYDSAVSFGQTRLLVAYTSLTRPDGYYSTLPGFSGTDNLGHTGLSGYVNNHIASILGAGVLSSVMDIGLGIASDNIQDTTAKAIANAFIDNAQKTSDKYVEKATNRQPTITIPPGTPVTVLVNKNITLPDYKSTKQKY